MDLDFIRRSIGATLGLTGLAFLVLLAYQLTDWAWGVALGSVWACANWVLIAALVRVLLGSGDRGAVEKRVGPFALSAVAEPEGGRGPCIEGCAETLSPLHGRSGLLQQPICPHFPRRRRKIHIAVLALVKFPLLYVAGYFLLRAGLPALSLLVGFWMIFVVVVAKTLGRMITGSGDHASRGTGVCPHFPHFPSGTEERPA
jgi:hypothetical protein